MHELSTPPLEGNAASPSLAAQAKRLVAAADRRSLGRQRGGDQLRRAGRTVLLVGTRHDYQRLGNPGFEAFRAFVAATCRERDIQVIAEEMSLDGLFGAKPSI